MNKDKSPQSQANTTSITLSRNILLAVSFIEGGAVMIIELLGAKIIAPYYGTSLYVWSSVLGVTLGALALGYFSGGYISKKYPGEKSLFFVLMIGAFFATIAPLIAPAIMQLTNPMGIRGGSLVSVLLYLLPSVTCMGMVSPMIIQLINKDTQSVGSSAGTVYAISTVGGILATFFAGFYLIPNLGIRMSSYLTGGMLLSIALLYFLRSKNFWLTSPTAVFLLLFFLLQPDYSMSTDKTRIVYNQVGILGEWTVVDYTIRDDGTNADIERRLLLNGIDQTKTQVGFEPLSLWKYPHKLGAYSSIKSVGSKALLLGMGGGSIAHELVSMGLDLDIVELDQNIAHISETYFNYDKSKSNLYIDDARHFIKNAKEKYDIVILDLVIGEVQPSHVFTLEGFEDLKRIINDDALVIINFQGCLEIDKYSLGPKSIFKTLEASGFYVDYHYRYIDQPEDDVSRDVFILASLTDLDYKTLFEDVRYNQWFPYDDFYYNDLIEETPIDLTNALVLTDDKPQLELINSTAILNWRKNKIKENIQRLLDENMPIY